MSMTPSAKFDAEGVRYAISVIKDHASLNDASKQTVIEALTLLNDRRYNTSHFKAQFHTACA